jgi:hypothetical protein
MKTVTIESIPDVNIPALDKALRDALGNSVFGLGYSNQVVQVYVDDEASAAQLQQAKSLVQSHDPKKLTPDQQAEVDRKAKLDQARKEVGGTLLDTSAYSSQSALIQQLAKKVAWLELELTQFKGGTGT